MTRMQTPGRLVRAALVAGVALCLLAAPTAAQLPALPSLPIGASASADTPLASAHADADERGLRACADAHADANHAVGLVGGAVPVPDLPVPAPQLPAAAADACVDADLARQTVSAGACADARHLDGATQTTGALPLPPLPEPPVSASDAQACAEAGFADGEAQVGADAKAGPIQQGVHQSVTAVKSLWGALKGLFA